MNTFTWVFLIVLAAGVLVQLWLARRQIIHVRGHRDRVPAQFRDQIPLADHQKAAGYTIAKTRFASVELLIGTALLLLWTVGGGLNLLDTTWRALGLGTLTTGVAFLVGAMLLMALLDLPLAAYRHFVLEQNFGFNRTTSRMFLSDLGKHTLISLLLGVPLAYLVLWLMGNAGQAWWLYVWAVWLGFGLLMMWAFPAFIAPLFNKFTPLEDAALRARIEALVERCGFSSNGVFVMDGSRRSSHGNAYFTGLGNNKRIVFFDTLLASLEPEEIEAVLAHELGHFKFKHVRKHMIAMALMSLAGLAVLGWLIAQPWFYAGLGIATPSLHAALALFLLVAPAFTFFLHPLMAHMMRRHEFEADDFAAQHSAPRHLIQALIKLYRDNASTLTPDPVHSAFYDSHPPAPLRVAHLAQKTQTTPKETTV